MSTDSARSGAFSLQAGYERVDDQDDPTLLVDVMDQTARWPATIALRAFEAQQLGLDAGSSLLDLGCGRGEVACALARVVQPGGRVLGVDASEAMLADARARAEREGVEVAFRIGDALELREPDDSFDAARAERVLQWIPETAAAVAELVRVVRPGGRISLIDTDWRTLATDVADLEGTAELVRALVEERGVGSATGGRLVNLCRDAGLVDLAVQPATHIWRAWDPDAEVAPSGLVPMRDLFDQLMAAGRLEAELGRALLDQIETAARDDRFFMSLTMFCVAGTKPDERHDA